MYIPTNQELYAFYSNRSLLKYPKSINTIFADIKQELNISKKSTILSYNMMNDQFDYIINNNQDIFDEINKNDSYLYFYMKNILDNQKLSEYSDLNNDLKYCANKYLYRISSPNYIFTFINSIQNLLPKPFYSKILASTISITFNNYNHILNQYIKKFIIFKCLLSNIKSSKNNLLLEFYNYSRFTYLFNIIKSNNLIPITYNIITGSLYFTISYSNYSKKEQIFERLHNINSNNSHIDIEEIKLYINTQFGEISNCKKLFDKKCNIFHSKRYVSDNLLHNIPNMIRFIVSDIILKFINKSYNYSYKKLLGFILNDNILVENYCRKNNNEGTLFEAPINNKWVTMSNSEIRKLSINNIDIKLLLDSYQELINPILNVVNAIKNR